MHFLSLFLSLSLTLLLHEIWVREPDAWQARSICCRYNWHFPLISDPEPVISQRKLMLILTKRVAGHIQHPVLYLSGAGVGLVPLAELTDHPG